MSCCSGCTGGVEWDLDAVVKLVYLVVWDVMVVVGEGIEVSV